MCRVLGCIDITGDISSGVSVIERLICDLDGVRIRNLGYERGSQHNFQGIPETYKRTSQTVDFKTYVSNG